MSKVIIVTGASRGIGRNIAYNLSVTDIQLLLIIIIQKLKL